jgi:hypothetical protein
VAGRVTGLLGKWIWSLAATGNQSASDQRVNATGIDAPGSVVLDRSDYTLDTGRVDASIGGPPLTLPAGPAELSVHLDGQLESIHTQMQLPGEPAAETHLSRTTGSAQIRARLPLTSPALGVLRWAGELTARMSLGVDQVSDFGTLRSYSYGLGWNPVEHLYLSGDFANLQIAPTMEELLTPAVVTPGVQMFDFVTNETDYVTQITGGDPDLRYTDRRLIRLGMFLGPFAGNTGFYANFEHRRDSDAVGLLPALTYAVEQAFPERFIRDSTGSLIEVDDRSVNLALEVRDALTWGINLGLPYSKPQGDAPPGMHLFISLQDTWYFRDTILVRSGVPELDLLGGAPLGAVTGAVAGAQPRNAVQLWATLSYHALGAQLSGRWHSAAQVTGGTAGVPDSLDFSALGIVNLRVFADLGKLLRARAGDWSKGVRVSVGVMNLLDSRERVADATGATPVGFQPGYLDPLGRMVTVSVRKVF